MAYPKTRLDFQIRHDDDKQRFYTGISEAQRRISWTKQLILL